MRKYIHAYIVDGQTLYTGLKSWSNDDLNGNQPIIFTLNESEVGYDNISSIQNWEKYGNGHIEKMKQIKIIFNETTWENLSLEEQKIVAKYFLVDKSKRDEVLTQQQQDDNNYYKIYNYLPQDRFKQKNINDLFITPKSIDYKKEIDGSFNPEYIFDSNGFLVEATYYENVGMSQSTEGFIQYNYENPILRVQVNYSVRPDGYAASRKVTRRWYRMDGSLDLDSKVTNKVYTPMLARNEGKRRRRNLINELLIETVGIIVLTSPDLDTVTEAETDATPFMSNISDAISAYYEYGTKEDINGNPCQLIQEVMSSTYSRLDNYVPNTSPAITVREYITHRLNV